MRASVERGAARLTQPPWPERARLSGRRDNKRTGLDCAASTVLRPMKANDSGLRSNRRPLETTSYYVGIGRALRVGRLPLFIAFVILRAGRRPSRAAARIGSPSAFALSLLPYTGDSSVTVSRAPRAPHCAADQTYLPLPAGPLPTGSAPTRFRRGGSASARTRLGRTSRASPWPS